MTKPPPSDGFLPRHAESSVRQALQFSRIVAIVGPRQSGKTTLAKLIAAATRRKYVTLDDKLQRDSARTDPAGFAGRNEMGIIDEVQKAPDLLLELKRKVDDDARPGQFLLTGSVDLFQSPLVSDSLAGRVVQIQLLPFSQAEISRQAPAPFIDDAFACSFPRFCETGRTSNLIGRMLTGGYPLALAIGNDGFRQQWLCSYAGEIAARDLPDLFRTHKRSVLGDFMAAAAELAGGLFNATRLGTVLGVDGKSADRLMELLELMFMVRRVPAWHSNPARAAGRAVKLHFVDSGLLAALRRIDGPAIAADRSVLGAVAESFVYSEIAKALPAAAAPTALSHYRAKNKNEVDFVLAPPGRENRRHRSQGGGDRQPLRPEGTQAPGRRTRRPVRLRGAPARRQPDRAVRRGHLRHAVQDAVGGLARPGLTFPRRRSFRKRLSV